MKDSENKFKKIINELAIHSSTECTLSFITPHHYEEYESLLLDILFLPKVIIDMMISYVVCIINVHCAVNQIALVYNITISSSDLSNMIYEMQYGSFSKNIHWLQSKNAPKNDIIAELEDCENDRYFGVEPKYISCYDYLSFFNYYAKSHNNEPIYTKHSDHINYYSSGNTIRNYVDRYTDRVRIIKSHETVISICDVFRHIIRCLMDR